MLTACALVLAGKKLVMPTAQPGVFPLRSLFGLRKWLVDKLMAANLGLTNTLYGTLYTMPWLRLLGARVGPRSEVSTVANIDPNLLTLGEECFVADLAVVGAARYYNGLVALGPTEIGARCFVGNSSLVPNGTNLADGVLIGVQSVPPSQPTGAGTSWLGSPAIFLPRRQIYEQFDESVTYRPPARLVACRLAIEFWRVVLPPTLSTAVMFLIGWTMVELEEEWEFPALAAFFPAVYLGCALLAAGVVAGLKWLLVGRYRPRVEPSWSHFVWRTELITGLYETVTVPWLLHWLTGNSFPGSVVTPAGSPDRPARLHGDDLCDRVRPGPDR